MGKHDSSPQYPCQEAEVLRYKFSVAEEKLIYENIKQHQGLEGINLLFETNQNVIQCTFAQLLRRSNKILNDFWPDDVLISKLVEKEHLIYQSHKDSKTGQLESFGVANPLFVQLFEKEGQYHQVFLDYTHTRYLNNNAQVCCITAQTQSGYTYLLSAYLFKDPQNNAFSGESLEKLETSVKFFHNAIPSLKHCRNVITDQAKAFNHAAALISPHCHSSLCGWHVWQLFKSDFGEKTNQIRYLFFNLLKSPTQADQDYRLRMLKEAIVEVNGKVNQKKWIIQLVFLIGQQF
ncbi:Hypothetical_protein [Hexamita inflata]|uniref:Hypothetical_protein n=1 Tax=Hexamita inflata TaxID=28002 RepID=A0AA86QTB8_9EUKA|nr:Hypothetical protein HINF_LOCUS50352 [Hexamita inflata]